METAMGAKSMGTARQTYRNMNKKIKDTQELQFRVERYISSIEEQRQECEVHDHKRKNRDNFGWINELLG